MFATFYRSRSKPMRLFSSLWTRATVQRVLLLLAGAWLVVAVRPAAGQVGVQIQDATGQAGEAIAIPVEATGLDGRDVTAYEFAVPFDSSVVELTGVNTEGAVTPSDPTVNVEDGVLRVAFSAAEPLQEDGTLLTLQGQLTGSGSTRLAFQSLQVFDQDGNEVDTDPGAGFVRSRPRLTGRIPDTSAASGATIALPIRIDSLDGADVTAYDLTLPFDSSVVEVTGVDVSGTVTPSSPAVNVTGQELRVSYSGTEALSGDGPLLTVQAQLGGGGSDVLDLQTADFFNSDAETVPAEIESGIVTVEGATDGVAVRVPDVEGDAGQAVTIPIRTDTLDGQGVTAYQFTLPFDPSVLDVTGVDTSGTTTPSVPTTNIENGEVRVSFSTTDPLSGAGALLKLRGELTQGGEDVLDFRNVQFFDGDANEVASTTTPGRVTTRPPSTSSSAAVGGDGEVTFEGTGASIVFSGVSGSGRVTVSEFSSPPSDTTGISEGTVAGTRYAISVEGDLSIGDGTEVRFDTTGIALSNFSSVTVYRRDRLGQGAFSALSTQLDEAAGELVATVSSFSEFALVSAPSVPAVAAITPEAISETTALAESNSSTVQVENTATEDGAATLTFSVEGASQQLESVEWLTVDPTTGSVAPGDSQDVGVTVRAVSTPPGEYETTLQIATNDPDQDTTEVPVSLTVERPSVALSNPDNLPAPDSGASVALDLPPSIASTEATFFYQAAETRSFRDTTQDLSGVEDGGTVAFDVPEGAVTRGGTRYYVELSGVLPDGETPVQLTVPANAPRRTAFLPAQRGQVEARGGFLPETYRMLTVPVGLEGRSAFEALEGQYGSYDPVEWKLARWSAEASAYRFGEAVDSLRPGEAAWLITAEGDTLSVRDARSADASGPRSVRLGPGWTQIGTPFSFPVSWAEVERLMSVRAPVAYDTSGYRDVTQLRPWRGAFVFNEADTSVTIEVPPVAAEPEQESSRGKSLARAASEADGYRLQMVASAHRGGQTLQDRGTWVGFAEGAAAGFGPRDRAKPPSIRSGPRLRVTPEEGPGLARSLKPVSSGGAAWDLEVGLAGDPAGPTDGSQEVTIVLEEEGSRPSGFERYVVDRDRGRRLPVTNGSVQVTLTEGAPARELRVIVGTEAFAERKSEGASLAIEETKLRAGAPNPFAEATTVAYQLAGEERVQVAVYDVLGRRVQTLVDERQEAGVHEVEWRPGAEAGLASGVYFCRMTAGDYTATRKLVLVR